MKKESLEFDNIDFFAEEVIEDELQTNFACCWGTFACFFCAGSCGSTGSSGSCAC